MVFVAHTGFEGSRSFGRLWRGELIDRTVWIRTWVVPSDAIPATAGARLAWLYDQWELVDAFIDEKKPLTYPSAERR